MKANPEEDSPRKKRKTEPEYHLVEDEEEDNEDVMPGFHEQEVVSGFEGIDEESDSEGNPVAGPSSRPHRRPPVSAPAPPTQGKPSVSLEAHHSPGMAEGKARAKSSELEGRPYRLKQDGDEDIMQNSEGDPKTFADSMLECPICLKNLETDNQGLNAHIDFCLSRGAIWEAQGETVATSSTKKGVKPKSKGNKDTAKQTTKKDAQTSKAPVQFNWGPSKKGKAKDGTL